MIKIKIFYSDDGKISGFHTWGHSGTNRKGHDIVCAGVSAITQTTLLGIGKQLGRDVLYSVDPKGSLEIKLKDNPDELTEAVFGTMLLGLSEIARANPKAVEISGIKPQ